MRRAILFFIILFFSIFLIFCEENIYNEWIKLCDLLEKSELEKSTDASTTLSELNPLQNPEITAAQESILKSLAKNETEDSIYQNLYEKHKEFASAVLSLDLEKIRRAYPAYILEKQKLNEKSGQVYGIFVLLLSVFIILGIVVAIAYQNTIGKMNRASENFNTILRTQEDERKRISLELHDGIAQKMRYVSMVASRIDDKNVTEIKTLQTECINELRSVCYNLYSPDIERGDLQSAIQMLAIDFKNRTETEAKFYAEENIDFSFLTEDQMHDVFRIIQESLSNIEKHAKASEVVIFMRNSKSNNRSGLIVIVTDNGIGLPDNILLPPPTYTNVHLEKEKQFNHFGIQGMMSRAKKLHGEISFNSIPNEGTEIKLFIPNTHREAEDEKFFSC